VDTRREAINNLTRLGWVPTNDYWGAAYHIACEAYEKCVEMGEAAVEPLANELHRVDLGLTFMKMASGVDQALQPDVLAAIKHLTILYPLIRAALLAIGTPEALKAVQENRKHLDMSR
jgi:hypothetical protein